MKYSQFTLSNNIHCLFTSKKQSPISFINITCKVGSKNEDKTNLGISHFLEHMLFKTTKKRSTNKLLSDLDGQGALYNAMTTYEHTMYEIHGNKDTWKKLMDILLDLYLNPKLLKKDIEIESVGKFLTTNLKAKIKEEALDLNLLKEKRQAKLPI